ncbi:hypothetical protein GCM10011586_40110 [Silvibacterium dinghuense]|nr:hypothetical protein GCM10011586_40110 [Silvibacterium dinghuense]
MKLLANAMALSATIYADRTTKEITVPTGINKRVAFIAEQKAITPPATSATIPRTQVAPQYAV